jgi:hypothetical protein
MDIEQILNTLREIEMLDKPTTEIEVTRAEYDSLRASKDIQHSVNESGNYSAFGVRIKIKGE